MGLHLTLFLIFLALLVVLLDFFGPSESDRLFWKDIHSLRGIFDGISYTLFNVTGFLGIGKGIHDLLCSESDERLIITILKRTAGIIGILLLLSILIYSIRRYLRNKE